MLEVRSGPLRVSLCEKTLRLFVEADGEPWRWADAYAPTLVCREGSLPFASARHVEHVPFRTGVGRGIESRYEGFQAAGRAVPYAFATRIWIEEASGCLYCEWIPLCEQGLTVERVLWPGPMAFDQGRRDWYTLLTVGQGLLVPNDWPEALGRMPFDGFFGTAGAYMPWFAQVRGRAGDLALCETPCNAGWQAEHPAGGPYTHVGVRFEPSLGRMRERRTMRYAFFRDCDYNDLCKTYRAFARERGLLCTLSQKAAKTPRVDALIGCSFVHVGVKRHIHPLSDFYDRHHPARNDSLTSFARRAEEVDRLHALGAGRLYLHLDGWAQPGYDNQHPDALPACAEAGGWAGMRALADRLHAHGDLFGIHDQYRDYYRSAPSFDEEYACRLPDGSIPEHSRWAGGPQSYLCATQALFYVRRNFSRIRDNGVALDGAYLDVFTCNEGDECANPRHRMSRQDCYAYRLRCFEWLHAHGILPSSEEVADWSMPSLVFCHYAPYDFMLRKPGSPRYGLPVPLFNLVYHDCVITPWMMEKTEREDLMLYALLNGGAPYLIREGAYPNTDGAFGAQAQEDNTAGAERLRRDIARCAVVAALHERVAKCEMTRHMLLDADGTRQQSVFSNGTTVTVDFAAGTYDIRPGENTAR